MTFLRFVNKQKRPFLRSRAFIRIFIYSNFRMNKENKYNLISTEMREWKLNFLICLSAFWLNLKPILLRSFQLYKATLQHLIFHCCLYCMLWLMLQSGLYFKTQNQQLTNVSSFKSRAE